MMARALAYNGAFKRTNAKIRSLAKFGLVYITITEYDNRYRLQ